MSSDATQSYPTFVDLSASHMTVSDGDDQNMAITVFVDQSPSPAITDSQSTAASTTNEKDPTTNRQNFQSPDEQDCYENDVNSADDSTHVWVKEEVTLLFKLYKERQKEINDPHKKMKDTWLEIAAQLKNYGYNPTPKQCDRKLRNMKATYIKTLDRMKRGDHLATCQYYDELYDIYGFNPPLQTTPRLLLQNRNRPVPRPIISKSEYGNSNVNPSTVSNDCFEPSTKKFIASPSGSLAASKQELYPEHMVNAAGTSPFQRDKCGSPMGYIGQSPPNHHKIITDFQEELKAVKAALNAEKEGREADRKAFEEERKDFHKERMSMLSSIDKLIGNRDQQLS
eukprot:gene14880-16426_t